MILNEGVNKLTRRNCFFLLINYFFGLFERCVCVGNVGITQRGSFALFSFYGESKWKWK